MSYPYSHPSMPGTPADFPHNVTASPKGPNPWHDTCTAGAAAASSDSLTDKLTALLTPLLAEPLESPPSS